MAIIEVENVSKVYQARRSRILYVRAMDAFRGSRRQDERIVALDNVSFTVEAGDALGIIGSNGSGKSTLLKILAGVTVPTSGVARVRGRVVSLLELGAGFHPLLTGRENVYLNGSILGMRPSDTNAVFEQIVEFSGIRDFIDQPVNTYSSGMYVRLAFAVAIHTNPDVFLVDEVLSVGDEEFQRRCRTRIGELREQNKTIIFVSHDLGIVNTLCNRVVLLSRGQMLSRGTPQATIDYYLRQIGRDIGIHRFSEGDIEAIFCHGRISLFKNEKEVTSPRGLEMYMSAMGQGYSSLSADWTVEERGPNYCRARGRMLRLPVVLLWEIRIENACLLWRVTIVCEQEVVLSLVKADAYLPTRYVEWVYDDLSGTFSDIHPGDLNFTEIVTPNWNCRDAAALPAEDSGVPAITISLDARNSFLGLLWSNSDYVTGSRVLQSVAQIPETDSTWNVGTHEFLELCLDLGSTSREVREKARAREAERTLRSGNLEVRIQRGGVLVWQAGRLLTHTVHLHTETLIAQIWGMSYALHWSPVKRVGEWLSVTGASPRFPYCQKWEVGVDGDRVLFRVWIEVSGSIDIEEYNVSVGLIPEYNKWETPFENGAFPDFDVDAREWRHLNQCYAAAPFVAATGPGLPRVSLETADSQREFHMTVINTGYEQQSRVLQAIHAPKTAEWIRFEPGNHLLFDGCLRVTPEADVPSSEASQ